jgi:type VI secretion system protein ImpL
MTLLPDLLDIYGKEFIAAWDETLGKLRLRPLSADKPKYIALSAASSTTSPIRQLLVSIRDETTLTQEREIPEIKNDKLIEGAASKAGRRFASKAGRAGRVGFDLAMKAQLRADGTAPRSPGQNIEAYFKPFHVLVDGDSGKRPIDTLVFNLNEIYQNLILIATNPVEAPRATANLQIQIATLRANSSRLPDPLAGMMRQAADDFEGDATGTSIAQLRQALAEEVTAVCQKVVSNRYPISRKSKRDVPMRDFGRIFAPAGVIDSFFKKNLASLADVSGKKWQWRAENRIARDLSPTTLLNFQQAAEIRDAFFPTGGNMPSLNIQVEPLTMSGSARMAQLEVNGNIVVSQKGFDVPTSFQWPGSLGRQRAAITITPLVTGIFGRMSNDQSRAITLERTGAWALYRLLDAGRVVKRGDDITARFVVGGREVSYRISAGSFLNPLVLPALRNFSCPAGL